MAHSIIMRVFERCLPHNVPLRSRPECVEQFSKIKKAFQWLEKSCVEVSACLKKSYAEEDDSDSEGTKQGEALDNYNVEDGANADQDDEEGNLEEEKEEEFNQNVDNDEDENDLNNDCDEKDSQSGYMKTREEDHSKFESNWEYEKKK